MVLVVVVGTVVVVLVLVVVLVVVVVLLVVVVVVRLKFAVTIFGPVILMDAGLLLPLRSPLQFKKA